VTQRREAARTSTVVAETIQDPERAPSAKSAASTSTAAAAVLSIRQLPCTPGG
jgi:hypothetical protein